MYEYVVVDGESVSSVAVKFRVPPDKVRALNGLFGDSLHPGQRLLIPVVLCRTEIAPHERAASVAGAFGLPREALKTTPEGDVYLLFR